MKIFADTFTLKLSIETVRNSFGMENFHTEKAII